MEASLKSSTVIAGRYRILAKIGEGGFGTVYKARDQNRYGKIIALKEINMASLNTQEKIEVTDTFNREISLLSNLTHVNLARIHNQFTDPEHWYIVMDYIEGQTLEELLARSPAGKFSVKQTVKIAMTLCDVLAHLHKQDPAIIFRDVKPGNIMLTPWDRLYLIDFGIARRYRPGQTRDTGSLGSPGYAAPEQYGRTQTTIQTDIYGLGATLQTLLTGKEPLEIRQQGWPPDVQIPWKLQALLIQMMDPDPFKRPANMDEVKKSLTGLNVAPSSTMPAWLSTVPVLYFLLRTITASGFTNSSFMTLYPLIIPVLLIGYCSYGLVRSWRATPTGLSIKASLFILQKLFTFFCRVSLLFTFVISLIYALLAQPYIAQMNAFYLWVAGASIIIFMFIFLIVWLKRLGKLWKRHSNPPTPSPMAAPLQQQRRS